MLMNFAKSGMRNGRLLRVLMLSVLLVGGMMALVLNVAGQEGGTETAVTAPEPPANNTYGTYLPAEMSYQGQLVDSSGLPQVGSYTMQFGVYGPPPTYTLRYSETQTVPTDPEGLFNVMIGAVQPGLDTALAGGDAWLQVLVDGELLAPLQPIGTVPYAQYAQRLVGGSGEFSAIGGGSENAAGGYAAGVSGGLRNNADGNWATIGGGVDNLIAGRFGFGNTIGGGYTNSITETLSGNEAEYSTIAGGREHVVRSSYSTVGGGYNHTISAYGSTIAGGVGNTIAPPPAANPVNYSAIGGGQANVISQSSAFLGGGYANVLDGYAGTIGGGFENRLTGDYAVIAGGQGNFASGEHSAVLGGEGLWATGSHSVALGGSNVEARGAFSFAAGRNALATDDNSFVWNSASYNFVTQGEQVFAVNAPGGIGFNTGFPQAGFHVLGDESGVATDPGAHVAFIENISNQSSPDVLALKADVADPGSSVNYVTFFDSSGAIAAIEGNGSGGVAYVTSGADFAEYLPLHTAVATPPTPGTVLGLIGDALHTETAVAQRVFVVSSAPAFVGNAPAEDDPDGMALVALMGQTPVRVRGPVAAGDLLVASGLGDGTAVAISLAQLTPASQIVGQALESHSGSGKALVNTLIGQPNDAFWVERLSATETQLADMEARLATLEALLANAGGSDE